MYKDNKLIASAKTDSNGNYKIKAVHGNYQLAIAFTGYKYFTSNVSVVTNRTTYVENVLLVEDTDAQGTATGKITNALTGTNIEGVTMQIDLDGTSQKVRLLKQYNLIIKECIP